MQRDGTAYTLLFAAAVCFVCSALVCGTSVLLKERQELNRVLDRREKVLQVAGLLEEGEHPTPVRIQEIFDESISSRLVDMRTGWYASPTSEETPDIRTYDQRKAISDAATSFRAEPNSAQVRRIANYAIVYLVLNDRDKPERIILPLRGKGLWSTMYAYLALESDLRTIHGIIFYEHGETPGLGGEIENPRWVDLWEGRKAYDEENEPRIQVSRGRAGPPEEDPYRVDGITGATLTSNGVSHMMEFWLGEHGFGPFLNKLREQGF